MTENFFNDILSKLGAGKKELVFITISQNIGVEMIKVDPATKSVSSYARRPLQFNETKREIANFDKLKDAIVELFSELNLSEKSNVILSLPAVTWGQIELPLHLSDEFIESTLISEVEQSYIFKKCEPLVSWMEVLGSSQTELRKIVYSAIQKDTVENIQNIFNELGSKLIAIENSTISTLRGLLYTGITVNQMADENPWDLVVINSYGYSVYSMNGKTIRDYFEEPMPLKTYDDEEIYNEIVASLQITFMNRSYKNVFIISETEMVNAGIMARRLNFDGEINFFDDSPSKTEKFIDVSLNVLPSYAQSISLKAVGVATLKFINYPVSLNFLGSSQQENEVVDTSLSFMFKDKEYVFSQAFLLNASIVIAVIVLLPTLALMLLFPQIAKQEQAKLDKVNEQVSDLDKKISALQATSTDSAFNAKAEVERVIKANRSKLINYSALGESIPKSIWLEYFKTDGDGTISIKGNSGSISDIYKFFKNLKDSLCGTKLYLQKLEMQSSLDDAVFGTNDSQYEFEITNQLQTATTGDGVANGEQATNADSNAKAGDKPKENKQDDKAKTDSKNPLKSQNVKDLEPIEDMD